MSTMNRLANCKNHFQGKFKKVLCVCSAGLLRSPTAAFVLSTEFDCNTRAAGLSTDFALVPVDEVLLEWADEIVCMSRSQQEALQQHTSKRVINLDIPDQFEYRDPKLMELIRDSYQKSQTFPE